MPSPVAQQTTRTERTVETMQPQTTTTMVTTPAPVVVNPMMSLENWVPLLSLILIIAGVMALIGNSLGKKITEFKDAHKPVHDAIDRSFLDVKNDLAGTDRRVSAIEQGNATTIERIVKLETNYTNIEKTLTELKQDQKAYFGEISDSIRELREVKPKKE